MLPEVSHPQFLQKKNGLPLHMWGLEPLPDEILGTHKTLQFLIGSFGKGVHILPMNLDHHALVVRALWGPAYWGHGTGAPNANLQRSGYRGGHQVQGEVTLEALQMGSLFVTYIQRPHSKPLSQLSRVFSSIGKLYLDEVTPSLRRSSVSTFFS